MRSRSSSQPSTSCASTAPEAASCAAPSRVAIASWPRRRAPSVQLAAGEAAVAQRGELGLRQRLAAQLAADHRARERGADVIVELGPRLGRLAHRDDVDAEALDERDPHRQRR